MDRLIAIQRSIEACADLHTEASLVDRLCVTTIGDHRHVDFYGDPFGEPFGELLDALLDVDVAHSLVSLVIRGPDEGSNGTRNWDLTSLAAGDTDFPWLRSLNIEQTKPADHNRSVVAQTYEEAGVLARILAKAPRLEVLVTPSAPNAEFFQIGKRPIRHLSVDAGYDHQGFIANFARSACFPDLRSFEFGEYNETYMEDFSAHCTPFRDYCELFASSAFAPVKVFQWRNPVCSPAELAEIGRLKQDRQILIVRWSADWMR